MHAFDPANPPLWLAASLLSRVMAGNPRRLAFGGRSGAGKTSICLVLAGTHPDLARTEYRQALPVSIINHADLMKEEVLEWVANARKRALIPGNRATFVSFCAFLGISPGIVEKDMWELLGPVWEAFNELLEAVYDLKIPIQAWADYLPGENLQDKVAFVDTYKPHFRTSLQLYGEAIKEISGNPFYWVEHTVNRGITEPLCCNGDTRYPEEMEVLRSTGWTGVYVAVDPEVQDQRVQLTSEQRAHVSENALMPSDCDFMLDGNQPLGKVVMDLAEALSYARVETRR